MEIRNRVLENFESALQTSDVTVRQSFLNFVIVGGGPTGVELAGALGEMKKYILKEEYPELDISKMKIFLIEAGARLLAGMTETSSAKALEYLQQLGATVILNSSVKDYLNHELIYSDNKIILTQTVLWTAGVQGMNVEGIGSESILKNKRMVVDEFKGIL